jgi:hypothetical protein
VTVFRALRARVGRRGAALLAFAFIDLVIAYGLFDPVLRVQTAQVPAYRAISRLAPLQVWAWLWLAVGVACAAQAFMRDDRYAYTAAIGVKVVWAAGFAAAWLAYGVPRAWLGAATWAVFACLVLTCAGWREPDDPGR